MFADELKTLKRLGIRGCLHQLLAFLAVASTALAFWKGLSLALDTESPIVVVLSGSMEPAYYRGDLLFLSNRMRELKVGDVIVYSVGKKEIPIVHRVIGRHDDAAVSDQHLLTKGDNNADDDTVLYGRGVQWLNRKDIIGKVDGYLPYLGYATILMNDHPQLKYLLLGALGINALINRE